MGAKLNSCRWINTRYSEVAEEKQKEKSYGAIVCLNFLKGAIWKKSLGNPDLKVYIAKSDINTSLCRLYKSLLILSLVLTM